MYFTSEIKRRKSAQVSEVLEQNQNEDILQSYQSHHSGGAAVGGGVRSLVRSVLMF